MVIILRCCCNLTCYIRLLCYKTDTELYDDISSVTSEESEQSDQSEHNHQHLINL